MSWAAFRQTTRIEDRAYSLMGLFGVHMSLLYGEKEKAFIRLQQRIMKTTADQSLFAWKDSLLATEEYSGLLAKSPDCFVDSACYRFSESYGQGWESRMTKGGLSSRFYVVQVNNRWYAYLDCFVRNDDKQNPVLVLLKLKSGSMTGGASEYARIYANSIGILEGVDKSRGHMDTVFVRQDIAALMRQIQSQSTMPRVFISPPAWKELAVFPANQWNPQSRLLTGPFHPGKLGAVAYEVDTGSFSRERYKILLGIFGLHEDFEVPWIHLLGLPQGTRDRIETSWLSYVPLGSEGRWSELKLEFLGEYVIRANISSSYTHGSLLYTVRIRPKVQ